MKPEPQPEHRWLQQLVGDWTYESDCNMGPDQPPTTFGGTETVKPFGDLWTVGEGTMLMPDGGTGRSMMTLGYNPLTKRYVGTWVGTMMTHLWVYDGQMSDDQTTLTLAADGPDFSDPTRTSKYHDTITLLPDGTRTLTATVQGADGQWTQFMKTTYRRVK